MLANITKQLLKAPWSAQLGVLIVALNLFALAFAPSLAPYTETEVVGKIWEPGFWTDDCSPEAVKNIGPCWSEINKDRVDGKVWLGTDHIGRDLMSRLLFGARNTITIALVTTGLSFVVGMFFGFLAATMRGWVDQALSRTVDIMIAFPTLIFALLVLSVAGSSIPVLIAVIALLDSTRVYRLSRAIAMDIEVMEFVEAARLRGEGLLWLMRREILPNTLPPLVSEFGLRFCFVFLFLSALSFLGLGLQPPTADWGSMVKENSAAITFGIFTPLLPAAAIAFLTIGVNLVVDWFLRKTAGIRDDY
jgi:peptide/nickel transport system permease protein